MSTPKTIREFFTECRRLLERSKEIREQCAAMRDAATNKGIDWSQLKALASADVADEEKGDGKKVAKLIEKADFACAYADMLGLRRDARAEPGHRDMNENTKTRSSIEPAAAGPLPVTDSDSEAAECVGPHLNGRIEPGLAGLPAASTIPESVAAHPDSNGGDACVLADPPDNDTPCKIASPTISENEGIPGFALRNPDGSFSGMRT